MLEGWPEVADLNRRVMEVGLAGGTISFHDQHLVLHRNGVPEDAWMDLNYSPVLGENGAPAGVLAIVVETTQWVKAQKKIENREEQLRLAQEAGGIGIFDLDIVTNLVSVTPEFCRLYGIEQVDVIPSTEIERLVIAEDSDVISNHERRVEGQTPRHPWSIVCSGLNSAMCAGSGVERNSSGMRAESPFASSERFRT